VKRLVALALLIGLGACNRQGVADVTLDAAAAQRNATAAKTLADLQAATDAAQGPAPVVHDAKPAVVEKPVATVAAAPADTAPETSTDDGAEEADTNQ
jgi:hypothetical protein